MSMKFLGQNHRHIKRYYEFNSLQSKPDSKRSVSVLSYETDANEMFPSSSPTIPDQTVDTFMAFNTRRNVTLIKIILTHIAFTD